MRQTEINTHGLSQEGSSWPGESERACVRSQMIYGNLSQAQSRARPFIYLAGGRGQERAVRDEAKHVTGVGIGAQCLSERLGLLLGDTTVRPYAERTPASCEKLDSFLRKQPGPRAAVMAEDMLSGPRMATAKHRL